MRSTEFLEHCSKRTKKSVRLGEYWERHHTRICAIPNFLDCGDGGVAAPASDPDVPEKSGKVLIATRLTL